MFEIELETGLINGFAEFHVFHNGFLSRWSQELYGAM